MSDPSVFDRLKRARIVHVLVVYIGASWMVLQVAQLLQESLELPEWVAPVAVILLLIGLVIISATAWVQAHPTTTAREEAGEVPTDWEIAPADILASLKAGEIPHLTWGRAIMGGVLAFWFLFGLAGVYVVFSDGAPRFGPAEAGADEATAGIAVLPFDVRGQDLEVWREGMVDLLSAGLDGVGGFRTIDSKTVLARWQETVGDAATVDLDLALTAAGRTGARYALSGSAVAIGPSVRLTADIYDLSDGSEIAQATAEGPADSVLAVVDRLGLNLMRELLAETGSDAVAPQRLASLTTPSLPALRAFLDGEAHFRRAEFTQAITSFEEAVAADSTFALALYRLFGAYGWTQSISGDATREYARRASRYLDRLPMRDRAMMEVELGVVDGTLWSAADAQALVRSYPDDPEAWYGLAEAHMHRAGAARGGHRGAQEAFDKAIELSPSFLPYYFHAIELAIAMGDAGRTRELLDRARALDSEDSPRMEAYEFSLWAYVLEEDAQVVADSLDRLDEIDWEGFRWFNQIPTASETLPREWDLFYGTQEERDVATYHASRANRALGAGRESDARARLRLLTEAGRWGGITREVQMRVGGIPDEVLDARLTPAACGDAPDPFTPCDLAVTLHSVDRGRIDEALERASWSRSFGDSLEAANQLSHGRVHRSMAQTIEGYVAWTAGDLDRALAQLDSAVRHSTLAVSVWHLADVREEDERFGLAISALRVFDGSPGWEPFAHLRIGELAERINDRSTARTYYESALEAWADADEGFEPKARAAAGLARVGRS